MKHKKYSVYIFAAVLWVMYGSFVAASADEAEKYITADYINEAKNITQGELAVMLVNSIGLESLLPEAPITSDYINALDKNGIRPLTGWVQNAMLTKGDFAVILIRAMGLENKLVSIEDVCDAAVRRAQRMWDIQYRIDGRHEALKDLFKDKRFFPKGPSENPFGHEYTDIDGDYKVDPIVAAEGHKELQPSLRYIYTLEDKGITIEGLPEKILTLAMAKKALRSPVFRSAPGNTYAYGFKQEAEAAAEKQVTPITPGGP